MTRSPRKKEAARSREGSVPSTHMVFWGVPVDSRHRPHCNSDEQSEESARGKVVGHCWSACKTQLCWQGNVQKTGRPVSCHVSVHEEGCAEQGVGRMAWDGTGRSAPRGPAREEQHTGAGTPSENIKCKTLIPTVTIPKVESVTIQAHGDQPLSQGHLQCKGMPAVMAL